MNKTEILNDYKNEEERLLIANCLDKLEFSKSRNKIEYTDFFNLHEQDIVDKLFKKLKIETYYLSRKAYRRNGKKKSYQNYASCNY